MKVCATARGFRFYIFPNNNTGSIYPLWLAMQDDSDLMAVFCSRQLHIYRNGKKVLVLTGKAAPKIIREDKLCEKWAYSSNTTQQSSVFPSDDFCAL